MNTCAKSLTQPLGFAGKASVTKPSGKRLIAQPRAKLNVSGAFPRHVASLRSICETLGKDWGTSAHCVCGKLCIDPIHLTTKEMNSPRIQWRGLSTLKPE